MASMPAFSSPMERRTISLGTFQSTSNDDSYRHARNEDHAAWSFTPRIADGVRPVDEHPIASLHLDRCARPRILGALKSQRRVQTEEGHRGRHADLVSALVVGARVERQGVGVHHVVRGQ